jgi:hypothetical protein
MLRLLSIFDDAVRALAGHADRLEISPLPATVYLMQMDVINHYRHALDHYLTMPLDALPVRDSQFGTPYQKWAHVTNEDFGLLSFAIHNLLRYTSRLVHESELFALCDAGRYSEITRPSSAYTGPICEIRNRGKAVGLTVHPGDRLSITAVRADRSPERVICRASAGGPTRYYRITCNLDGVDQEIPIGPDEYQQAVEVIRAESIDVADRTRLVALRDEGHAEVAAIRERNRDFKRACDSFYLSRPVAEPFEKLNESYWI